MDYKNQGYIALITALILAAVITTVTFILSESAFLGRYNALIFNDKRTSRYLTESCLETARLRLEQNSGYTGNETVALGANTCAIGSVQTLSDRKIITAASAVGSGKTVLKLEINPHSLEKIVLEELVQ